MRAVFAALAVILAGPAPTFLRAQATGGNGVIVGVTTRADNDGPLSYVVASIPARNQQTIGNANGVFVLRDLAGDTVRVRLKHLGFASHDTVVRLRANDTVRIRIELTPLVIDLPPVRVAGPCGDKRTDPRTATALAELLEQVTENAERYRLLADSNPFVMRMYRVIGFQQLDGQTKADQIDTLDRSPYPVHPYRPGMPINVGVERGMRMTYLSVPELADFADSAFTNNHCFTYVGRDVVDGDSVITVEFEPAPTIADQVDVKGTLVLRARDFVLMRSHLTVSRLSASMRQMGIRSDAVSTVFREIVPGVPILWHIESNMEISMAAPQVEVDQVFDVRWVKGPP